MVYLSHDDGEGHGFRLGDNFADFIDRWTLLGCPGAEDWQMLPFIHSSTSGIDPWCENARRWRQCSGLEIREDQDTDTLEVIQTEHFAGPDLESIADDLERLLDYALLRPTMERSVSEALGRHDKSKMLASLQDRLSGPCSTTVEVRLYEISEVVLGPFAEDRIRQRWATCRAEVLFALAAASTRCLPSEEAFSLAVRALDRTANRELCPQMHVLAVFQSEKTLDWIEAHVTSPVTADWGSLAAVSRFSWPRAAKWLDRGRPLSLVALDALYFCEEYDTRMLQELAPRLLAPASKDIMVARLERYAQEDKAPRVKQRVSWLISHWNAHSVL